MMRRLSLAFAICLLLPAAARADDKPAAPPAPAAPAPAPSFNAFNKMGFGYVKGMVLRSAEKMPEENYAFKPADSVRTFGQILGHVADSNYYFCSVALGEKNPAKAVEKTKTSKADLVAALQDAVAYCNKAFDGMTDTKGSQTVKFRNFDMAKLTVFSLNTAHTDEHYGNMVTYLRIKGIVPPTSENPPGQAPK